MLKFIIPLAIATLFIHQLAYAQGMGEGIDHRQANQMERIRQGIATGELTRPEAARLLREAERIRQQERFYRSDGVLTARERADLRRNIDNLSWRIYEESHDRQRVAYAAPYRDGHRGFRN